MEAMRRCYVPPPDWQSDVLPVAPDEAHHLIHVLRLGAGDRVQAFDGQGRSAPAAVLPADGRRVLLRILEPPVTRRPLVTLRLVQALPRGQRMDWIVEKAAEIGVGAIYPTVTERVVSRRRADSDDRPDRWRRLAVSAAKQSGSLVVPDIAPVLTFEEALDRVRSCGAVWIASVCAGSTGLHEAMDALGVEKPADVALIIGPEGDLTPAEVERAVASGAVSVHFGANVLRVETAALYGLSVLQYELLRTGPPGRS
jgi:16S rRNA (uracil1498-N3)-methyltransferase